MSREQITLYGDDAAWFREVRDDLSPDRDGQQLSNPETIRRLLDLYQSQQVRVRP
jgi:hypothetical protein